MDRDIEGLACLTRIKGQITADIIIVAAVRCRARAAGVVERGRSIVRARARDGNRLIRITFGNFISCRIELDRAAVALAGIAGIGGLLHRIESPDDIEGSISEGQALHLAHPQVVFRRALTRN